MQFTNVWMRVARAHDVDSHEGESRTRQLLRDMIAAAGGYPAHMLVRTIDHEGVLDPDEYPSSPAWPWPARQSPGETMPCRVPARNGFSSQIQIISPRRIWRVIRISAAESLISFSPNLAAERAADHDPLRTPQG